MCGESKQVSELVRTLRALLTLVDFWDRGHLADGIGPGFIVQETFEE